MSGIDNKLFIEETSMQDVPNPFSHAVLTVNRQVHSRASVFAFVFHCRHGTANPVQQDTELFALGCFSSLCIFLDVFWCSCAVHIFFLQI